MWAGGSRRTDFGKEEVITVTGTKKNWELDHFEDGSGGIDVDGVPICWWDEATRESFVAYSAENVYRGNYLALGEGGDPSRAIELAAKRYGLPFDKLASAYEKRKDEVDALLHEWNQAEMSLDALESECKSAIELGGSDATRIDAPEL